MSSLNWWVKHSEELWRQYEPSQSIVWSARFGGDDGQAWLLVMTSRDRLRSQEDSLRWDPRRRHFASNAFPTGLQPHTVDSLRETLSRRSVGIAPLTSEQQRLLDAIAANLHAQGWPSGRRLRQQLGLKKDTFRPLAESLSPRHLREVHDSYTLTLPGLLACAKADQVTNVIEGVLSLFRARFHVDMDFRSYTWDELQTASGMTDLSIHFVGQIISAASLTREGDFSTGGMSGNPPRWHYTWNTPSDIEELSECRTLDDFVAYIRQGNTGRPWPTAPALLPEEMETRQRTAPLPPAEQSQENTSSRKAPLGDRIFIGHGRSLVWLQLKNFLQDRLGLTAEEFNSEPAAGHSTTERLEQMIESAGFAFIVMTGEDPHVDGTLHARKNVIHEAGLFQGRLGFKRAIILLEEGCAGFSNIYGLTVISFPKGDVLARSEDIRQVLERESILPRR
jgi:hypothetical protein